MDRVIGNYDFCACGTPIKRGQTLCDRCRRAGKELEEKVAGGMMDDKRQHTPPWETTEACADALREQLAARAEDAAMADELARAAHAMADALDRCDDALSGVFVFLYAHGMPYDGPTYIVERRVLCETLARYDATKGVGHE